jgi:hypothetical protein
MKTENQTIKKLNFKKTIQKIRLVVKKYNDDLKKKHYSAKGSRSNQEYIKRRINAGCMATLDAVLKIYEDCIFSSYDDMLAGIISRRYQSVKSANIIQDHLKRLEGAGIYKSLSNCSVVNLESGTEL